MVTAPPGTWRRMRPYDEAFDATCVRAPYRDLLDRLDGADLDDLKHQVAKVLADDGVRFGGAEGQHFEVDPVPRILTCAEWETLTTGVQQRVRALEAFLDDAYGEQRLVADGVVPASVMDGSSYFEEDLVGVSPRGGARILVAGLDIVRDAEGEFRVLEDNVRTPSGVGYAMAASDAVCTVLGLREPDHEERRRAAAALRRSMEAAAPGIDGELVLLTDGESSSAWYEQCRLADLADLVLATPGELRRRGSALELSDGRRVRCLYRRTDDDRLREPGGGLTDLAQLLLDPLRDGELGLVNWYGSGVADDKVVYALVDELIREMLGEEPLLRSVATFDLADADQLEDVLERMEDLVVKPRDGMGGRGVTVGPAASAAEVDAARQRVREEPEAWIAQEAVLLSTVPAVVDGQLAPRHCDLRPFAISDGCDVVVPSGGLTRVALAEGSMVVNSSREGGAKATWVV